MRKVYAALLCLVCFLFSGCSAAGELHEIQGTSILVHKNGGMTYYLTGELDKTYYDIEGLSEMANREAEEFNAKAAKSGGGKAVLPVKIESVKGLKGDVVLVEYKFDCPETFEKFTQNSFFSGTVQEAAKVCGEDIVLKSPKDGSMLGRAQMRALKKGRVIATDARARIYCPAEVLYLSEGLTLSGDGSVDTSQVSGTAYILFRD